MSVGAGKFTIIWELTGTHSLTRGCVTWSEDISGTFVTTDIYRPTAFMSHTRSDTTLPHLYRHLSDLVRNLQLLFSLWKKKSFKVVSVILLAYFNQFSSGLLCLTLPSRLSFSSFILTRFIPSLHGFIPWVLHLFASSYS